MRVGIVGWRGMVGSVLMERMRAEGDFALIEPRFYSSSQAGQKGPSIGREVPPLIDAGNLDELAREDVIITAQGGDYTTATHAALRQRGFSGYWIDAASTLRMQPDAVIILDPLNRAVIDAALKAGRRDFVGGNCTVSLMLLGLAGLINADLVEWITAMTYQAASGAGAANMKELIAQMGFARDAAGSALTDPGSSALEVDARVQAALRSAAAPTAEFGVPLAASLIPWIDKDLGTGQSREEWKAMAEANKILGREQAPLPVDGICVRVGAMRCHSQALTLKLRRDLPLAEIEERLATAHPWARVVPNTRAASIAELSPLAVGGTLTVPVGRLRKLPMGGEYLTAFTIGDQLLWGAAEPLRRMLRILLGRL